MLVLVVALAALVFAPAAVAQDDNPSADEIAELLHVGLGTVHSHVANIFSKLEVSSRLQALVFAVRHGVLTIASPQHPRSLE